MDYGFLTLIQKIAQTSLDRQEPRPGDYEVDGIIYCGTCGKARQGFKEFSLPTEENPDNTVRVKMGFLCDCDKAEEEREKAEEQRKKDFEKIEKLRAGSGIGDVVADKIFDVKTHDFTT